MTVWELRDRLIADGIAEVREVYANDEAKREGAIEGFELCRSLDTREAFETVLRARESREFKMKDGYYRAADKPGRTAGADTEKQRLIDAYWRHRYGTLQVEWVMKCLDVAWGAPVLSGRALRKVADIVGTLG